MKIKKTVLFGFLVLAIAMVLLFGALMKSLDNSNINILLQK